MPAEAVIGYATQPRGTSWHPEIAADPTSAGLTKALHCIGFDVEVHLSAKVEMMTVLTIYNP